MRIVAVESAGHLEEVRKLFQAYWDSFGFTPCFQNFGAELAGLPGAYTPPDGRLALAMVEDAPAGCVALRRIDGRRGEAKRLYVRPEFRGQSIGRALLEWVIREARAIGYAELVGDTMPVMEQALALYERMGFQRTSPYLAQPTPGAICIRLALQSS